MNREKLAELAETFAQVLDERYFPYDILPLMGEVRDALREASLDREYFSVAGTGMALTVLEDPDWVGDLMREHHQLSVCEDSTLVGKTVSFLIQLFPRAQNDFALRAEEAFNQFRDWESQNQSRYEVFESVLGDWITDQSAKLRLSPKGYWGVRS